LAAEGKRPCDAFLGWLANALMQGKGLSGEASDFFAEPGASLALSIR
jgi:hypothetical protein